MKLGWVGLICFGVVFFYSLLAQAQMDDVSVLNSIDVNSSLGLQKIRQALETIEDPRIKEIVRLKITIHKLCVVNCWLLLQPSSGLPELTDTRRCS